ncbi:MAG: hypothetical protein HDKAJFGB_01003 [Anaerolineae bacterium]|nr:hypothetical protein [Anaerolineae bacterium]
MPKHIPQRTCIACRSVHSKRELLRIVRAPEGHVVADPTGKRNGRGTYVHKTRECFENVLGAPGKLQHALNLQTPIPPADLLALQNLVETFPATNMSGNAMNAQLSGARRAARKTTQTIKQAGADPNTPTG